MALACARLAIGEDGAVESLEHVLNRTLGHILEHLDLRCLETEHAVELELPLLRAVQAQLRAQVGSDGHRAPLGAKLELVRAVSHIPAGRSLDLLLLLDNGARARRQSDWGFLLSDVGSCTSHIPNQRKAKASKGWPNSKVTGGDASLLTSTRGKHQRPSLSRCCLPPIGGRKRTTTRTD